VGYKVSSKSSGDGEDKDFHLNHVGYKDEDVREAAQNKWAFI